jgi:hypothetical protein
MGKKMVTNFWNVISSMAHLFKSGAKADDLILDHEKSQ